MKAGVASNALQAPPPELKAMTAGEVAELLGLSPKTVYEHASRGQIPGVIATGARKVRFARPVILAWLAGEQQQPAKGKRR